MANEREVLKSRMNLMKNQMETLVTMRQQWFSRTLKKKRRTEGEIFMLIFPALSFQHMFATISYDCT